MSEQRSSVVPDPAVGTAADETGGTGVAGAQAAALELLGLAAFVEMGTFGQVAALSVDAPDLPTRHALAAVVCRRVLDREEAALDLAARWGSDPTDLMAPFSGVLDDFDVRTATQAWWEGLLTITIGHGVAQDLCLTLADGLPDTERDAVLAVLYDEERHGVATELVAAAVGADDKLASRLGLWGRRVVGEALSIAQALVIGRPTFARLAELAAERLSSAGEAPAPKPGAAGAAQWLMALLTAEHTRRMDRMGLPA
jgi:tRNA-(MS[2]IO[6]A)-hydroxylase (MiaE)-like